MHSSDGRSLLDNRRTDVISALHFQEEIVMGKRSALAFGVGAVLAVGCARHQGGGNPTVDSPPQITPIAIKALRQNPPVTGTPIAFKDVVVVGRVVSSKYGHLWVQDQGGGQYSGIQLFCNYGGSQPSCSMTKAQLEAFNVGQVVSVTGKYDPYTPKTPPGAETQLEVSDPMITASAQMMAPVAIDVTADVVAKDQFTASTASPYKGALVHVTGGPFMVSTITAMEFQAQCTSMTGMVGTTYYGFEVTGGQKTLAIGTNFYDSLTFCLQQCGYPCPNPVMSQTFSAVTGVVENDTNTNGMQFLKVSPVSDDQLPM
jgi:hypothetical protein